MWWSIDWLCRQTTGKKKKRTTDTCHSQKKKKRNAEGEGKRSRLFANQTVMFYNASSATLVFCLCGSWLFNGWIETKWISFNHISFFLFLLAKRIVGKRKRESRTTFPKLLFFVLFLSLVSFYLNIWGNNKKKRQQNKKRTGDERA